jgi:hypothetical protein
VKEKQVTTQAEFDAAIKEGFIPLVIVGSFEASGSTQVRAYDSAQVTASGSAQVTASGSAQVTAYDSAQVTASKFVACTLHDASKCVGGRIIRIVNPRTVLQWCSFYGLKAHEGKVTLFKAVTAEFKSNHNGFSYIPGTTPTAPDWDGGREECGGGLHFSPHAFMALKFHNAATKFLACPVRLKDIRTPRSDDKYPEKVKAKGCCGSVWECDIDGKPIKK